MTIPQSILDFAGDLTAIRQDLHAHPELGFEELRTSGIVAEQLRALGIEVTTGIGKTGVVGVIKGHRPGRAIGLRADMDALPIQQQTNLPYASRNAGVMHACGHDAHTTILLGAARYLAAKGSVCLDGISLTVNGVNANRFDVNIVPHTLSVTTMNSYALDSRVNLEVDVVARYVERLLDSREGTQ